MANNDREDAVVQLRTIKNQNAEALKSGGGGGSYEDADKERLAKLEGAFDGIRTNQTILMSVIAFVSALLIGFASFTLVQIGGVNTRIGELPGKIGSDLRDITKTLSEAITAAKQAPPQVILLPAPAPAPEAPRPQADKPNQ